jgi:transcriptional regulator with XRE-family HTH domain
MLAATTHSPTREVLRCDYCQLVQFATANGICRRCRRKSVQPDLERRAAPGSTHKLPNAGEEPPRLVAILGARIRSFRTRAHLSQRQLAMRLQCPRTYISKTARGRSLPRLKSLERIAESIHTSLWFLLCNESEHQREALEEVDDPVLAEIARSLPSITSSDRQALLTWLRDRDRFRPDTSLRTSA